MQSIIDNTTPIVMLTVEDLRRILHEELSSIASDDPSNSCTNLVYGIRGIEKLFHVSHRTAQFYKNTFLQPAVRQNGRKIVVDADHALRLFDERNKQNK